MTRWNSRFFAITELFQTGKQMLQWPSHLAKGCFLGWLDWHFDLGEEGLSSRLWFFTLRRRLAQLEKKFEVWRTRRVQGIVIVELCPSGPMTQSWTMSKQTKVLLDTSCLALCCIFRWCHVTVLSVLSNCESLQIATKTRSERHWQPPLVITGPKRKIQRRRRLMPRSLMDACCWRICTPLCWPPCRSVVTKTLEGSGGMISFLYRQLETYGYGSIPINTIFRGMNIHLPAILMFTRGTRFWHTAIFSENSIGCSCLNMFNMYSTGLTPGTLGGGAGKRQWIAWGHRGVVFLLCDGCIISW